MGAVNLLLGQATCPRCGAPADVVVQFKFGRTWRLIYAVGARLEWGGLEVGRPGMGRVVVDGVSETPCTSCNYGSDFDWNFYVFVEKDVITGFRTADGRYDFAGAGETFVELPHGG